MIDTWLDWTFNFFTVWLIVFYLCIMCYFCLILLQLSSVYTVICTSTPPSLIHSLGRFLTTLDLYVQILDVSCYWLGVRWNWTCCKKLEFLSNYFDIIVFLFIPIDFVVFLILYKLLSVVIPFSLFMWYHVWAFICSIAVMLIDFLQLIQVTLGLAHMSGVLSSRIYIADSRRDSVPTYFGKRGVIGFLWY